MQCGIKKDSDFPREICTQTYLSIFIMFVGGGAAPAKPLLSMVVVTELQSLVFNIIYYWCRSKYLNIVGNFVGACNQNLD